MILTLFAASILAADVSAAHNWPGFRGDGTSRSPQTQLPLTWSPTQNFAWKADLPGYGQSSPTVWQNRVYLTSVEGVMKEKLHLICLDAQTGKTLWQKAFEASQKGKNNPMMSRAAAAPVADADGVYALFESGDLFALTHDGQPRWQRHFAKDFGELKNNHGLGNSPAQTEKAVIVLLDHQGPSKLVAVLKSNGQNAWAVDRAPRSSWTSPVVMMVNGKPQVVVSSSGQLAGYNADDGSQLWEQTGLVGNSIPSPTFSGTRVFVAASENRMKPDAEATSRSNACFTISTDSRGVEQNWHAKKFSSGMSSPLVHEGHVYFVDKAGFVLCVDEKTGAEKYRERLENLQWATPIGSPGRVYFFGKDGVTTVLKTGQEFEKLAVNRLWSDAEFQSRKEVAKKEASATLPKPPEGKGPGGGPPLPKEELEATRYSAVGDVVYGVAPGTGRFFIRTGTQLFALSVK